MSFTVDTRDFRQAIDSYVRDSREDAAAILNHGARDLLGNPSYGLINKTPKANKSAIRKELTGSDRLALRLAAKKLKGKGGGSRWAQKVGKEARDTIARRQGSAHYISDGWVQASAGLGGNRRKSGKSRSRVGRAKKATTRRLVVTIENNARGAAKVALPALRAALPRVVREMERYGTERMRRTAQRYSSR